MIDQVEMSDGSRVPLANLQHQVPHTCFMSDTHLDVCERLSALISFDDSLKPVHMNYLVTKSNRTKQLTALITLIGAGKMSVRAIETDFIGTECADLLGDNVRIALYQPRRSNLINARQYGLFFAKVISHRLFRILRKPISRTKTVIRGWVDTTDSHFHDKLQEATLLVYPFKNGLQRQVNFLRRCRREGRTYSMMGVPFRLGVIPKIIFRWRNRERLMVDCEAQGFLDHATEILSWGTKTVYATDDFEMASWVMHNRLIANHVRCVNHSHGVGVYGPYVKYSHFTFYNDQQKRFYQRRGTFDSHDFLPVIPDDTVPRSDPGDRYDPVIIFVQGNWRQVGKHYEAELEDRAIFQLKRACQKLELPMVIKVHPNIRIRNFVRIRARLGLPATRELEGLAQRHPVFIVLLSTAYYGFLRHGPSLFLEDDLVRPYEVFGEGIPSIHLDSTDETLASFRSSAYWSSCHQQQISREQVRLQ